MRELRPGELPITGYLDRLSRRPGERLRAHVSVRDGGEYRARLVRVISADANPRGPGIHFQDLGHIFDQGLSGRSYPIAQGSHADAPAPSLVDSRQWTWTALVQPRLRSVHRQVILSHEAGRSYVTLSVRRGKLRADVSTARGQRSCEVPEPLTLQQWHRVWISCNDEGLLIVGVVPVRRGCDAVATSTVVRVWVVDIRVPKGGRLLVAARHVSAPRAHFNGRIEDPAIIDGINESWAHPLQRLSDFGSRLHAGWDYSLSISTQIVEDVGPFRLNGFLKNGPKRAIRGARWTGEAMRWCERPDEYGAIHFHSDDLSDCEWPVAFEFVVPGELSSGSYAFHLSCSSGEDWIPFYVLPRRTGPRAKIVFLAPTFTYQTYANDIRGNYDEKFRERVRSWRAFPFDPKEYPLYGSSTYNKHPDGSGVAFTTRLRPMLSMRPAFITINDAGGSGLRHYPADAQILAWLESRNLKFDIVTDEDLHEEGSALLSGYSAVLTGTHPEYQTKRTLDALQAYVDSGGKLIYLGGNGFYWRVARDERRPEVLEVRRAEGGTRAWAEEPGEYYHATDGTYGGLWRRNGRNPQALVGVGFSAQGGFEGTHYRRTAESYDSRYSWVFEGVEGDLIGDYGLSGGAAAGYELDRADVELGTPEHAVILARSEGVPRSFFPAMEELLIPTRTLSGIRPEELIRADMVLFQTAGGGAVFSVGSITFCGSLWRNGFEGPVSQLLENVVREFAHLNGAAV